MHKYTNMLLLEYINVLIYWSANIRNYHYTIISKLILINLDANTSTSVNIK